MQHTYNYLILCSKENHYETKLTNSKGSLAGSCFKMPTWNAKWLQLMLRWQLLHRSYRSSIGIYQNHPT